MRKKKEIKQKLQEVNRLIDSLTKRVNNYPSPAEPDQVNYFKLRDLNVRNRLIDYKKILEWVLKNNKNTDIFFHSNGDIYTITLVEQVVHSRLYS